MLTYSFLPHQMHSNWAFHDASAKLSNVMPIGMANQAGRTEDGVALWRLSVNGADVPGEWMIVVGEFRFVEVDGQPI